MNLKLFLDKGRLEFGGGRVTCPIWIEVDGNPFPEEGWDDFSVVLLGWWITAASSGDVTSCFLFMDGPFRFELSLLHDGLEVVFFKADREIGKRDVSTSMGEFLIMLKEEAALLVRHLANECPGLRDPDLLSLAEKVEG